MWHGQSNGSYQQFTFVVLFEQLLEFFCLTLGWIRLHTRNPDAILIAIHLKMWVICTKLSKCYILLFINLHGLYSINRILYSHVGLHLSSDVKCSPQNMTVTKLVVCTINLLIINTSLPRYYALPPHRCMRQARAGLVLVDVLCLVHYLRCHTGDGPQIQWVAVTSCISPHLSE